MRVMYSREPVKWTLDRPDWKRKHAWTIGQWSIPVVQAHDSDVQARTQNGLFWFTLKTVEVIDPPWESTGFRLVFAFEL